METKNAMYGPMILRIFLGLIFIIPGFNKLMNPGGIIGMLTGLGFPAPAFFAWILLLSEIVFGLALLLGLKVRYTVWPLVIVLAVAILAVTIPSIDSSNIMAIMSLLWHLIGIAGLINIYLTGPGAMAVSKS